MANQVILVDHGIIQKVNRVVVCKVKARDPEHLFYIRNGINQGIVDLIYVYDRAERVIPVNGIV